MVESFASPTLCGDLFETESSPIGPSSINRAVSRPKMNRIFQPFVYVSLRCILVSVYVCECVVMFGYVPWILGSAPAL